MYERIVVGFDESVPSQAALSEAAAWVKRHGGEVILVHAVFFDSEEFGIAPEQLDKRMKIGEKMCIQARDAVSSEYGIRTENLLCEGEPPEVIVNVASGKKADLIVLGTYGRRGLNRLLMGSVTSHVIVNSTCDVLVVRKKCVECAGRYQSILVPFDGSEFGKRALQRACELSKVDGSAVTVLYVIPRYEEMIGFLRTDSIKRSLADEARKITDAGVGIAAGYGVTAATEVREGHAADEINEAAGRLGSDLVVLGTYGWRGVNKAIMGSTTERVIMHANCPVLAVR